MIRGAFNHHVKTPKLFKKSWWRQLKIPLINTSKIKRNSTSSSSNTTLDWRSLSPDRPPLPFFLPDNSPTSSMTSIAHDRSIKSNTNNNTISNNTIIPTITTTTSIDNSDVNNISQNKSNRLNTEERNYQPLCPILEESETMATDSSLSNHMNSRLSPSSMQGEEESRMSSESAASSVPNTEQANTTSKSIEKKPMIIAATDDEIEQDEELRSMVSPPERKIKSPSDKYMSNDLIGNEELCKRKFAKMVLAASKFKSKKDKQVSPSHMALMFDAHGNIDMMRMVREGISEYHKFCGNSQYVPPELSINIEYNTDLADIWVLGIFLYRMLIGKYPFSAENDQQLFKKMLHGNFSIPQELSEDAKDLLRRMLAPDMTRASLDLVIYHPWIKTYRPLLLEHHHPTPTTKPSTTPPQRNISKRSNSVHTTSDNNVKINHAPPPVPKKSSSSRFLKKAMLLLFQGPFPPPRKPYRDLSHLGTRDSVFARQQQKV